MLEFFDSIDTNQLSFNTSKDFIQNISTYNFEESNHANQLIIGQSEEGRPIHAFQFGSGSKKVILLGGSHSDEPVGPQTLRALATHFINNEDEPLPLFDEYSFFIIPHVNPDGEAVNWNWIQKWPNFSSYLANAFREQPGRDIEFGYPNMRIENKAVSTFMKEFGPFELYINFHGMAIAEGIMLLIERHRIDGTEILRSRFIDISKYNDLPLHDHDRDGDKGFKYLGPGFTTTPEGKAMREHFKQLGDEETASKFHSSSMEYIRSLGKDPLCLVTELPLFLVESNCIENSEPGVPQIYLSLKKKLPQLQQKAQKGESLEPLLKEYEIKPISLGVASKIHIEIIKSALQII